MLSEQPSCIYLNIKINEHIESIFYSATSDILDWLCHNIKFEIVYKQ